MKKGMLVATWTEFLQISSLVIGVGTPAATLIYNAGKTKQWRQHVTETFDNMFKAHNECMLKREIKEAQHIDRLENIEKQLAYSKGFMNGNGKKFERREMDRVYDEGGV
jgi:hypothetical protein